jgi:hypothetical protein
MKVRRLIPVAVAAMALMFVPGVLAQSDQTEGSTAQTVKKTKRKAKKEVTRQPNERAAAAESSKSQATETQTTRKARTESVGSAHRTALTVSESEISAAKADGKVWVNTGTGVYHKSGQWYGTTKQGKFMTEQEAIRAGYRAAKQ